MPGDFCLREGTGAIHLNGAAASKPNIGASMLERLRACATCSRSSTTAALAEAGRARARCSARVLQSGCQLFCTCTQWYTCTSCRSLIFLLRSSHSLTCIVRLALCRRSVTGRGSSKAVHRPKDEENFSTLHQNATKGRHDTFSQQQRDFISHQRQYGTWLN